MNFLARVSVLAWLSAAPLAFSPALGKTQALLVGIGTYKNASDTSEFRNLKGAAIDVASMRAVLQDRYGLAPGQITSLADAQATREAILDKLRAMIVAGREGDQLLFYFSGHGALVSEGFAGGGDEADRIDETIVPFDSRGPDGVKDIRDDELRELISAASERGINVVTIFDSCNSGSATRGGARNIHSRAAPPAEQTAASDMPALPQPTARAKSKGFHVHLASARDGEMALEAEQNGQWRGDFTEALVSALRKLPSGASYKDILAEVRLHLTENGLARQHPRGEGELNRSFMGTQAVERRIFEAKLESAGSWRLLGGKLAGVLPGSKFAFFRSSTDAVRDGATPIGIGTVVDASATAALVASALPDGTPAALFARETERKFAPASVRVSVGGADARAKSVIEQSFKSVASVQLVESNPQLVLVPSGSKVTVQDPDGFTVATFDAASAAKAAKSIGSYFALLQLRDAGRSPLIDLGLESVRCVGAACESPVSTGAAAADESGEYRFHPGDCFRPVLKSREAKKRHVYLLQLGSDFSVTLVHPAEDDPAEADSPLEPRKALTVPDVFCMSDQPGRDYFMLVATDTPVDLSVLQQDAVATRGGPLDPLSRLLQQSRQATRGSAAEVSVENWGVKLVSAVTEPKRGGQ